MIKKIIYIIILILLISTNCAFAATKKALIEHNGCSYAFKQNGEIKFLKCGDKNFRLYENAISQSDKNFYLDEAMKYYFLVSKINKESIGAQIGLGRVYDKKNMDKFAQKHFYNAINIDENNPEANLYFADFFYKRKNLITAEQYYKNAYKYGYSYNPQLNYKMGTIYEKLADIESAKKFYSIAFKLSHSREEIIDKIRLLDELNYSQSQYYLFGRDETKLKEDKL